MVNYTGHRSIYLCPEHVKARRREISEAYRRELQRDPLMSRLVAYRQTLENRKYVASRKKWAEHHREYVKAYRHRYYIAHYYYDPVYRERVKARNRAYGRVYWAERHDEINARRRAKYAAAKKNSSHVVFHASNTTFQPDYPGKNGGNG